MKPKICLLCSNPIPTILVVDGKTRNLQNRKYCFDCSPYGSHNTRSLRRDETGELVVKYVTTRQSSVGTTIVCSECSRKYVYDLSKGHTLTLCNSCSANRQRNRMKRRCVEYKGGKCLRCGYNKSMRALIFHHRDPSKKEFTIGGKMTWNFERVAAELDKCDLLCSNCHSEVHEEIDDLRRTKVLGSLAVTM